MDSRKSTDPYKRIIIASLFDVQTLHSDVFTRKALRLTLEKVSRRLDLEGIGLLTKTFPRLAKTFDRALTGDIAMDAGKAGFRALPNSKLPKFLGELFQRVFSHDGKMLETPCVKCIKTIRQVLLVYYKYELPYSRDQEQRVLNQFRETDRGLGSWNELFDRIVSNFDADLSSIGVEPSFERVIRRARDLLSEVFSGFDPQAIHPRHGPGAVSTRETLHGKYTFRCVSPRIRQSYPLDAYFYASLGHVCDDVHGFDSVESRESSARVLLVPKDSRGPRLISCEPLDFQYVQQGLGRAIVQHLESHPLTRWNIHFTDQRPNQVGSLLGSSTGGYATLDLKEASDRVTIGLVRLLFPQPLLEVLMNCRSLSTVLPGGEELTLQKFAPMGSALCFPIMATTIWAILAAGLPDADVRKGRKRKASWPYTFDPDSGILVYGDDVIVKAENSAHAISLLESFGLLINRDKSCTSGFFRESCGVDAYKGVEIQPVRIRTVWTSQRCPDAYVSWISYANSFHKLGYLHVYDEIVGILCQVYGQIPDGSLLVSAPSLVDTPEAHRPKLSRTNSALQKREWYVWDIKTPKVTREIGGWKMLLRYFVESTDQKPHDPWNVTNCEPRRCSVSGLGSLNEQAEPFSVRVYTKRKSSCLVKRWR